MRVRRERSWEKIDVRASLMAVGAGVAAVGLALGEVGREEGPLSCWGRRCML